MEEERKPPRKLKRARRGWCELCEQFKGHFRNCSLFLGRKKRVRNLACCAVSGGFILLRRNVVSVRAWRNRFFKSPDTTKVYTRTSCFLSSSHALRVCRILSDLRRNFDTALFKSRPDGRTLVEMQQSLCCCSTKVRS